MTPEELRTDYLRLLDRSEKEQAYQEYLEANTRLIPREFVQNHGIHCSLVLRKLPFGQDYKSDFFYFSKSSDDWNAVFIEIEKPSSRFFKGSGTELHSDFTQAHEQINRWRAWLSRDNMPNFLNSVRDIQVPRQMASNPTHSKFVLVFGRRNEYANSDVRRSLIQSMEREDFKIVTFDSLAEDLGNKNEVSIGVRHNEFVDIITDEIIDSRMYAWVEPTQLRVSKTLYSKLRDGRGSGEMVRDGDNLVDAHTFASSRVRIR